MEDDPAKEVKEIYLIAPIHQLFRSLFGRIPKVEECENHYEAFTQKMNQVQITFA